MKKKFNIKCRRCKKRFLGRITAIYCPICRKKKN